ncbi:hypothetical protein [Demetria terragena]|uniref:hypothetical protein n=1 Tax=Demetria terragena TaxID=63959 RepID=UPI00036E3844|nr:hypothetical protein [Demetria terragena]
MLRAPLPDDLPSTFTVREARAHGVRPGRLRAADLATPFAGVRLPTPLAHDRLAQLRALAQLAPHAALSHQTAATVWRLPLPSRLERDMNVHVTVPVGTDRMQRCGVVGHSSERVVVTHSSGLRVTDLGETWCDLATQLTFTQLVQAGDALINREGWDLERLGAQVERARRRRGVRTLRAALAMLRPGSRSPRESECRLLFDGWALPAPELNADLFNASGWLACVDFLWRDRRVVAEYYGKVHGPTWQADLARAALIEDEGYAVVVITDGDLGGRQARLRDRLVRLLT